MSTPANDSIDITIATKRWEYETFRIPLDHIPWTQCQTVSDIIEWLEEHTYDYEAVDDDSGDIETSFVDPDELDEDHLQELLHQFHPATAPGLDYQI